MTTDMADNFNKYGGYFAPPGYLKVETGGSHDENPNGGVQIGVDPNGVPNMLEEGEPVYDDYVYSDNITADKAILEQFNIPEKYAGKLYSEIADTFVDEAEDRPLDPISNNGLRAMLGRLADAQEQQKQNQEQKELEDELANMSPEELAELEAMISEQQQAEQHAGIMALGGPMNKFDGGSWMTRLVPDNLATMRYKLRNGILPDIKPLAIDRSLFAGVPLPAVTTEPEPKEENTANDFDTLPTWMRYTGALGHGLLALSNAVTPQTRFTSRTYTPQFTPTRMHLRDVSYNPTPLDMYVNPVLQQNAGTVRQLSSSGLGPSTGAAIIAADYNAGRNIGQTLLQGIQANEQSRNTAIAANNNNAVQLANFDYQQNATRDSIMNQAQLRNIQNDLLLQRLNDEAESQKYAAISSELGYGLDALTKMGDENMAFNMVNSTSDYGYDDKSGRVRYKRRASNDGTLLKKYKK